MSKKRVSSVQWEIIVEHLETHKQLARGYNNSSRGRELASRLWRELSTRLNAEGSGVSKSGQEWATYFNNYKSKLKAKVADFNKKSSATGGGPNESEEFTDLELRLLALLGTGFGQGLPNVIVNPFPNVRSVSPSLMTEDEPLQSPAEIEYQIVVMEAPSTSEPPAPLVSLSTPEPSAPPNLSTPLESSTPPGAVNSNGAGDPGWSVEGSLVPPASQVPPAPVRPRHARQRTRPMAPIDEARRILSQVELQRAPADAEQARAMHLIAENLGRLANSIEQFSQRRHEDDLGGI